MLSIRGQYQIRMPRELMIDNGSQFGAHRTDEEGEWNSEFKRIVESYGTKINKTRGESSSN